MAANAHNDPGGAVHGIATRGRGRVWHYILCYPGTNIPAMRESNKWYKYPHYSSACGAAGVESRAQLEIAFAERVAKFGVEQDYIKIPPADLVLCGCCARTSHSAVWRIKLEPGQWDEATGGALSLLDMFASPVPYLGVGLLAALTAVGAYAEGTIEEET